MVTTKATPTTEAVVLPAIVDFWPVFQVMVKVRDELSRRSRQDRLG
jgi:hypothetical protein